MSHYLQAPHITEQSLHKKMALISMLHNTPLSTYVYMWRNAYAEQWKEDTEQKCPTFADMFSASMHKRYTDLYEKRNVVCDGCLLFSSMFWPMGVCTEFSLTKNTSFRPSYCVYEDNRWADRTCIRINLLCKCCQCAVCDENVYTYIYNEKRRVLGKLCAKRGGLWFGSSHRSPSNKQTERADPVIIR